MGSLDSNKKPGSNTVISTVVPATPRGDENGVFQLNHVDLLMKLHYVRAVYFFSAKAVQGLSVYDMKKPLFSLLDTCYHMSGRIRRSETGRPFIKCNDAGVRIAESHCDMTLQEWFQQNGYVFDGLVHDHVLGPDLGFSPLVFFKFTWFKNGGLSMGISWAHVLGDAFSAFNFITMWSHMLAGHVPPKSLHMPSPFEPEILHKSVSETNPSSVKRAKTVGEYWLATSESEVGLVTHTFHVTSKQLQHLVTATSQNKKTKNSHFEILSALIWKYMILIREEYSAPVAVTICTNSTNRRGNEFPGNNGLMISVVEENMAAENFGISELANLIAEKKVTENHLMEKLVKEVGEGEEDFIVYGANLTIVDLEEANFYEVKLNGEKPILANCNFHGVGDNGVVLVLPAPPEDINGRLITVSLPEKELEQVKDRLRGEWGIV